MKLNLFVLTALLFLICAGISVAQTQHDNAVTFTYNAAGSVTMTYASIGYVITSGQPWGGVTSSQNGNTLTIDVLAGRQASTNVATAFQTTLYDGAIAKDTVTANLPSSLNFYTSGTLSINGASYAVSIGQGSSGFNNNWWIGGPDLTGHCARGVITTKDGKYTIGIGSSDNSFIISTNAVAPNWMQLKIPDYLTLAQFSIPGTHDSGTYAFSGLTDIYTSAQHYSLLSQLNMGIRVLDIRLGEDTPGQPLTIYHGDSCPTDLLFTNALKQIVDFLTANPGETVVMSVKQDHGANDISGDFLTALQSLDPSLEKCWLSNSLPTLGEVRGKIVVLNRNGNIGTNGIAVTWLQDLTFSSPTNGTAGVFFRIQDQYELIPIFYTLSDKIASIGALLAEANTNGTAWYINLFSCEDDPFSSLGEVAWFVNTVMASQLRNLLPQHNPWSTYTNFGTIMMDFAGELCTPDIIASILQINKTRTAITLASSDNPSIRDQSVTLTATVAPTNATGTVVFMDGVLPLATNALSGGAATYTTNRLSTGTHSFTAAYRGDTNYYPSSSSVLSQTVLALTTIAVTSSLNPSTYGESVTITASLSPTNATGTVSFTTANGTTIGASSVSNGTATCVTSSLTPGGYFITAEYSGDPSYAASASTYWIQTVSSPVLVWPTSSAIVSGQSVSASTLSGGIGAVPGSFAFAQPNAIPPVGICQVAVVFTPTDTNRYAAWWNTVSLVVYAPVGQSGPWSAPATWGGVVPGSGSNVVIRPGQTVTLDVNTPVLNNLTIEGTLTVSGGQTLSLSGSFTNHGTFNPGSGTVLLSGVPENLLGLGNTMLVGNTPTALTFNRLEVDKSAPWTTVTATSTLTVTRQLVIAGGKLVSASHYQDIEIGTNGTLALTGAITVRGHFTNSGTLLPAVHDVSFNGGATQNLTLPVPTTFAGMTVASNTTLIETVAAANASVVGRLSNQGVIRKRQTVSGPGPHTFGLAGHHGNGTGVVVHVTERTGTEPLIALQVDRIDANHPQAPGSNATGTYWVITPTGSNHTFNLTLPHNGLTAPHVCRNAGDGSADWEVAQTRFTSTNVTLEGVTGFGHWAVFNFDVPVATNATYARAAGMELRIRLRDVAWDADGNAITMQALGASAQGATMSYDRTNIYYHPANDQDDHFTYTVSNGHESATGTITVRVALPGGRADGIIVSGGKATIRFFGTPGKRYVVGRTTSLAPPVVWRRVTSDPLTPGVDGSYTFTDPASPPGTAYYWAVEQ